MSESSLELLESLIPINDIISGPKRKAILKLWSDYMMLYDIEEVNKYSQEQYMDGLEYFFAPLPYIASKRDMKVVASILAWLTSNVGKSFIQEANILSDKLNSRDLGYLYQWAAENRRRRAYNNGRTLLEYLVAPNESYRLFTGLNCPVNHFVRVSDIEVTNLLIDWLSSKDGEAFLSKAKDVNLI